MRDSGGAARHRGAEAATSGDALYGALDPIAVRAAIAAQSHRWLPASTQRLDEIGYLPFGREQANLFFQVVAKRYDLASKTAPVASARPFRVAPIHRTLGCQTCRWDVSDDLSGIGLAPAPIEALGRQAELYEEIAR
jgi:hypothetical protein